MHIHELCPFPRSLGEKKGRTDRGHLQYIWAEKMMLLSFYLPFFGPCLPRAKLAVCVAGQRNFPSPPHVAFRKKNISPRPDSWSPLLKLMILCLAAVLICQPFDLHISPFCIADSQPWPRGLLCILTPHYIGKLLQKFAVAMVALCSQYCSQHAVYYSCSTSLPIACCQPSSRRRSTRRSVCSSARSWPD